MPIELPAVWIVVLNAGLWPVLQLSLAWGFTRMPVSWFHPPEPPGYESVVLYERFFCVRHWKHMLPDAAKWMGGTFAKRELKSSDPDYLRRFIVETWRGELCHASAILFVPLFFLWNPWWGNCVVLIYAVLANVPCIIVQRYNRLRLQQVLTRMKKTTGHE